MRADGVVRALETFDPGDSHVWMTGLDSFPNDPFMVRVRRNSDVVTTCFHREDNANDVKKDVGLGSVVPDIDGDLSVVVSLLRTDMDGDQTLT